MSDQQPFHSLIENTSGLSQGVDLTDELLASIAISLKRIADSTADLRQIVMEKLELLS